jgi:phospholipid-binding lipoprotein MlaA
MSVNGMNKWVSVLLLVCVSQCAVGKTEVETNTETSESNRFWESWKKVVRVFKDAIDRDTAENRDPWEPWNRKVYAFNDVADQWVLTPLARGYQWVTPDPVETGIGNVFSNLLDINVVINDLLQFKLKQAFSDSGRFLINTTVGVGGLFDVASPMGLVKHREDFGQTLGKWGVSSGPYLVVPFLGPFTIRSGMGTIGDSSLDAVGQISHVPTRNQTWAVRQVHGRAALLATEALITGDRYTFIRDAYLQHRDYLVNDGVIEDDFGDEDFDEWEEE